MPADAPTLCARSAPLVMTREDAGVLVVTLQCESLSGFTADEVASICLGYAEPEMGGHTRQAVSLGLVREVNCAGLRALVQVSEALSAAGGRLIVFGAPQEVRAVVRRTGLSGRLVLAQQGAKEAIRLARNEPGRFRFMPGFGRSNAA
ncbi:MAG: STAS domain-containing protein [Phycisphaeraceae bacterium]|nr:MAG: STAS domain-containing protein [Phycisphaeraceae bacterium]